MEGGDDREESVASVADEPLWTVEALTTYGTGMMPCLPRTSLADHHWSSSLQSMYKMSPLLKGRSSGSLPGKSKRAITFSSPSNLSIGLLRVVVSRKVVL